MLGYNETNPPQSDTSNWLTFLNYYFWMQSCVDFHMGRVIQALQASPFWGNTIIVFHSDHGEYGGSHWLKAKAGALYDETINVPLYISFPSMRVNYNVPGDDRSVIKSFVCSSVDILPLLYTLSLGNNSWRQDPNDLVYYLRNREDIVDGFMSQWPVQRRFSSRLNGLAYILHTTDEFVTASLPGSGAAVPSHAIAFRAFNPRAGVPLTGGKLGMYSYWPPTPAPGTATSADTQPDPTRDNERQFEFYNYGSGNLAETGNSWTTDSLATVYRDAFDDIKAVELYVQYPQVSAPYNAALQLYFTRLNICGGAVNMDDMQS